MSGKVNRKAADPKQLLAWAALIMIVVWLGVNRPRVVSTNVAIQRRSAPKEAVEASPALDAGGNRVEVITELLNLRAEPNAAKKTIIGTLRKGLVIDVLERRPGWLKVKLPDGRTGFIADQSKYIKFSGTIR
ncbi:MAG: SH3 domain-containing protein [Actinomycetota bacterium]|nr:SH3 domain-containing protein [Actinomycetota bacterium]